MKLRPRIYTFKGLMDRLTSDVWFVLEIKEDREYAFAHML